MGKLKVFIVDKSTPFKKMLTQAVEKTGLGQVEYSTQDCGLALERMSQRPVDVLLINIALPEALNTLETIRKANPELYIIAFAADSSGKSSDTGMAKETGALDFFLKPPLAGSDKFEESIKNQLQGPFTQIMVGKYASGGALAEPHPDPPEPVLTDPCHPTAPTQQFIPRRRSNGADLVVIASSTGGTSALEVICKNLPAGFAKTILVVQHMPAELTKKFARSLDKKCQLPVLEAQKGDPLKPGQVMIAPGGVHMIIQAGKATNLVVDLEDTPPVNGVRPSADVLFYSLAKTCRGKRILAVILTGMGSDGMLGVQEMKKAGDCYCLAQSERTCIVYGMPKSVVEAGLADAVADLQEIPARILHLV